MTASYFLALLLLVIAGALKVAALAGTGPGFQAANWGIGACALFLCALASARMIEMGRK
jgi:hypothetical protein